MLPKQIKTMGLAVGLTMLVAVPVQAATSMSALIDGDTFDTPFSFTNLSSAGETVDSLTINLAGAGSFCFDAVNGGTCNPSNGVPFTALGGTDVTTGLTGNALSNADTSLGLTFSDFNPFETLAFIIDVDVMGGAATVLGSDLIGATVAAMFSDGSSLLGVFSAVEGNPDAAGFFASGSITTIPIPAGLPLLLTALGGLGFLARRREWA